ncbi:methylated-DNA--[protein]-cysteine S-methyltransferase [Haladaptatus sp. NG-WS-4]
MFVTLWDWQSELDESFLDASPEEIRQQVREYVDGDRREFDLHVTLPDDFTGRVMAAMTEIPRGETRTYGEVAEALDTAPIAVGQACGRNPVPIVVPCHRVVAADGLGGYSGGGDDRLALKRRLLDLESR